MPEPIAWQIQANVKTALDNIDGTGDYFYSLDMNYADHQQNELLSLDAYVTTASIERANESEPNQRYEWRQTFSVTVSVPVASGSAGEIDQRRLRAFTDVARAVMADPHRGSLAIDTQVLGYEPADVADGRAGVIVSIEVWYRTRITDLTLS